MHHNPARDRAIDSRGFPIDIQLEEDGALLSRYRVECRMEVPARLEENGGDAWQRLDGIGSAAGRSKETLPFTIASWITLRKGGKCVEVTTRFHNTAEHHRLRALFPTRRAGTTCHVESAYDVVERETAFSKDSPWYGTKGVTFPQQRFVDVTDGEVGLAVINDGLREYEVTQDNDRAIAITMMRAFEVSLCPVSKCWEQLPEMKLAQSPGDHEFRYRIYPHKGDYAEGNIFAEAEKFTVPLEVAQAGPHGGDLPKKKSFLSVSHSNLAMSAFKRSEDGKGYVLRLFNPTNETIEGTVTLADVPQEVHKVTLEEEVEETLSPAGNKVPVSAGPKKIVTLKVLFG
jgi:alpha-mannosidase